VWLNSCNIYVSPDYTVFNQYAVMETWVESRRGIRIQEDAREESLEISRIPILF